jgi:hypothetical protein
MNLQKRLERRKYARFYARLFDHFTPARVRCATIGRVLTHLSSASNIVRMFDAPHDENCEMRKRRGFPKRLCRFFFVCASARSLRSLLA